MNKVSVIIPLFNREALILETLNSLRNQVFENWEAIIVDDHSTDGSFEVATELALKDDRIRVYKRDVEPKGAPKCRNIGIEKAKGAYLIFLDSDDLLAPYCLKERVSAFKNHTELDYLVFNGMFFQETMGDTKILWNTFSDKNDLDRFLSNEPVWQTSGPIWKTASLRSNNLFFMESAKSSQDWEFHVKALYKNMGYKKIDSLPDYFVRRNSVQSANAISNQHASYDRLVNRVELYKELFAAYRLSKEQSILLLNSINKEIFHSYHKLSFKEVKLLWDAVRSIDSLNTSNVDLLKLKYLVLHTASRLTLKKSHQLVYFYRSYRDRKNRGLGYRGKIKDEVFKQLQEKLTQ